MNHRRKKHKKGSKVPDTQNKSLSPETQERINLFDRDFDDLGDEIYEPEAATKASPDEAPTYGSRRMPVGPNGGGD